MYSFAPLIRSLVDYEKPKLSVDHRSSQNSLVFPFPDGASDSGLISGDVADGAFMADPTTALGAKALKLFFPCNEVEDAYQVGTIGIKA